MIAFTLAVGLVQQAPTPTGSTGATHAAATRKADPIVCQDEQQTGSIFPKRICKMKSEWQAESPDAETLRNVQRRPSPH